MIADGAHFSYVLHSCVIEPLLPYDPCTNDESKKDNYEDGIYKENSSAGKNDLEGENTSSPKRNDREEENTFSPQENDLTGQSVLTPERYDLKGQSVLTPEGYDSWFDFLYIFF